MSLRQWDIIHAILICVGILLFFVWGFLWPLISLALFSVILLWITQYYTIENIKPAGGYANLLTLFRYLLVLLITASVPYWPVWSVGALYLVPVMLDGVDGYIARRYDHATKFGALFDLETDALFMALSGSILWQKHMAGYWLLPAIYLRYFYVLFVTIFGLNRYPEIRTRIGPLIAVIMFVSLLLRFFNHSDVTWLILIIASALIVISFLYSFFFLLVHKARDL